MGGTGHHLVGTSAPAFEATDLRTGAVVSSDRFLGSPTVLLFLSPTCPTCQRLMRGLADAWETGMFGVERMLAYRNGPARPCAAYVENLDDMDAVTFLGEHDAPVPAAFRLPALPALVQVDDQWRISACGYPGTWDEIAGALAANEPVELT